MTTQPQPTDELARLRERDAEIEREFWAMKQRGDWNERVSYDFVREQSAIRARIAELEKEATNA